MDIISDDEDLDFGALEEEKLQRRPREVKFIF